MASLGNRDEVRELFLAQAERRRLPRLLPRCGPIDDVVEVDRYLPGCPPTPELLMQALEERPDFVASRIVCQECGRQKVKHVRPRHLVGFQQGGVRPGLCLINQGYLCIGSSTRGGCRAPCPRAGHPCVGCRGPSDALIEHAAAEWLTSIHRVFAALTDIPAEEVDAALRSPQMALFLFQFSDYATPDRRPRPKEKVL